MIQVQDSKRAARLARLSLLASAVLCGLLLYGYIRYDSQLAFAQAADSFLDVLSAGVLSWTVMVSGIPRDANHHFGHKQAQPLGALVVAVITGVLALEVIHRAAEALSSGSPPELDAYLVFAFAGKLLFKAFIMLAARSGASLARIPTLRALFVDARNDVLATSLAIAGFFAARQGFPMLDSWLALPVALYIGYSGFELAAENVRLLMGEAPPPERQDQLMEIVRSLEGVKAARGLKAHYLGTTLHIDVRVFVDASLSVAQGRDIAEIVRKRIEQEPDVDHCVVLIDTE